MNTPTPNVDAGEVGKFDQAAPRWWDPEGEFKPLHAINPLRLEWIAQRQPLAGAAVLDLGCGGGLLTEGMARLGARVTGVDAGAQAIATARLHLLESKLDIEYVQSTAEAWAEGHAGQYDAVTCLEMLEHVPDPASVIQAIGRLVRPGGAVFLSTLNRTPSAWLLAVVGAEYLLRLLPRGTHDYRKFLRPSELAAMARAASLQVCDLTGLHYDPLFKHYSLGPGVAVNYLMHLTRHGA
jgi:2-polyprenyl-6-hydroxyphenyl methylase/3-demethylubiquinone-9 3-methyltransferase